MNRRQLLKTAVGAIGAGLVGETLAECRPTARNGRGPFYPDEPIPAMVDLTRGGEAKGEGLYVFGRIFDRDCQPLAGARVEIWQCDANGYYKHDGARSESLDPGFAYFAHAISDREGTYFFKTLMPVSYGTVGLTRAPHIHFLVRNRGFRDIATEMHFAGESFEQIRSGDVVFQGIAKGSRDTLITTRRPVDDFPHYADRFDSNDPCCQFDLVLSPNQ